MVGDNTQLGFFHPIVSWRQRFFFLFVSGIVQIFLFGGLSFVFFFLVLSSQLRFLHFADYVFLSEG